MKWRRVRVCKKKIILARGFQEGFWGKMTLELDIKQFIGRSMKDKREKC